MSKSVIVFESTDDIVVGIRYSLGEGHVNFVIAEAIDYPDPQDNFESSKLFNFIRDGVEVNSFEEANILASGRIFKSENPIDIVTGRFGKYIIKFEPVSFFSNEFEALTNIVKTRVVHSGILLMAGIDIENEAELVNVES